MESVTSGIEYSKTAVIRLFVYIALLISTIVVLGLSAHLFSVLADPARRTFGIFSVVAPAVSIGAIIWVFVWSVLLAEVVWLFILVVLWVTLASWARDIVGRVECFATGGMTIQTKSGFMSFRQYCYEMKSIQALSWANFAILVLTLSVLAYLISSVAARGYGTAWGAPVSDLPWFGEMQWGRSYAAGYPQGYYPQVQQVGNVLVAPPGSTYIGPASGYVPAGPGAAMIPPPVPASRFSWRSSGRF